MESNVTFISGLPRCRSAWLTTYAIAHGAVAIHEPTRFTHPELIIDTFKEHGSPLVFAGHDLVCNYSHLKDKGKWIIIQRDVSDVQNTLDDRLNEDVLSHYREQISEAVLDGALLIDYQDLNTFDAIKQVHRAIFESTESFNSIRADTLNGFNIEPHYEKYMDKEKKISEFFNE